MNYLGIDYGGKRIGLATSDAVAKIARPYATIINDNQIEFNLQSIIAQEAISELVVGLPRGLDGQETLQTKQVRDFVKNTLAKTALPIHFQDEAVTSEAAKAWLEQSGSTKISKEMVDMQAATIILQDYLDAL